MPITKQTGLFYELMIRGCHDPKLGPLGSVMTYQLMTGSALIDSDTNELVAPYAPDAPVDLTKDQAVAFLGEKMAGFLDQLTSEREAAADAQKAAAVELASALAASAERTHAGKTFSEPVVDAQVKTVFDGADFLSRLTDAEYGAILAAASQSIQLARWLDTFRLRGEIDVTGKTALAAKEGLVKAGLLAPDRADVIFAAG